MSIDLLSQLSLFFSLLSLSPPATLRLEIGLILHRNMTTPISKRLVSSLGYAYGLLTFIQYALVAIFNGAFLNSPTEKERLELALGKLYVHTVGPFCFSFIPPSFFFLNIYC